MQFTSEVPTSFSSTAVRPGPIALVRQGIDDILTRRRLIGYLVQADLRKKGADTLLGNVWWVVDPLLQMAVYVVLVSVIFQRPQPDYPLFIFCAILPWKWFQSSLQDSISSVVGAEKLIKQINFPKAVLPVSAVMAGIANFAFGLIPLAALIVFFYADRASIWLLAIPVVAFVQLLFTLPLALILGGVNVFYRDVGNLARHVLRLWFYLSPGIYGLDLITGLSDRYPVLVDLYMLNPFVVIFTAYRAVIYEGHAPDWLGLAILGAVSVVFLLVGTWVFKRLEPSFAKVL